MEAVPLEELIQISQMDLIIFLASLSINNLFLYKIKISLIIISGNKMHSYYIRLDDTKIVYRIIILFICYLKYKNISIFLLLNFWYFSFFFLTSIYLFSF